MLIGYVYIGRIQMAHIMPRLATRARRRHAELIFNTLVAGGVLTPTVDPAEEVPA